MLGFSLRPDLLMPIDALLLLGSIGVPPKQLWGMYLWGVCLCTVLIWGMHSCPSIAGVYRLSVAPLHFVLS